MRRNVYLLLKLGLIIGMLPASTNGQSFVSLHSASNSARADKEIHNDFSTLGRVLKELEATHKIMFVFNSKELDSKQVNRSAFADFETGGKPASVEKALSKLLLSVGLRFEKVEGIYVILPEATQASHSPSKTMAEDSNQSVRNSAVADIVTGKITTVKGEPLPGVSVLEKGTRNGTVTDADGNFRIAVAGRNSTLVFSFIGFSTKEVLLNGQTSLSVVLEDDAKALNEVVVVGYGTRKKITVVGAVSQVENEALMKSGQQNITNAIAGKVPGVLTIQQTGQPGKDDSDIIIRGLSSWNGSKPLVLVDGVERDFSDLDPNEVENISVLKDASSTAVFGARGANGVILVTTRRGVVSKPQLSFTSSAGLENVASAPKPVDSYTTMSLLNVALMNQQRFSELTPDNILNEYRNPSTPLNALRYPNVNWYDMLTKKYAPTTNTNLNIRGGSKAVKYFASLGYFTQRDFFKTYNVGAADTRFKYDRINYRTNLDFNVSNSTLLSLNLGGAVGITNEMAAQGGNNPWRAMFYASPSTQPAFFPAWVLQEIPDLDYPNDSGIRIAEGIGRGSAPNSKTPYALMNNGSFNQNTGSQLFTDLILDQKLDFVVKGLSAKGKVALSTYFENNSLKATYNFPTYTLDYSKIGQSGVNPWRRIGQGNEVWAQTPLDINVGGLNKGYYRDLYYEMSLAYKNTFGNHHVSGLALLNRQQKNAETDFPFYNQALVGAFTYDYANKYLFELNLGYTGSERFAPQNRFGFFPSIGVGYVVSEEKFFKKSLPWMNKLKIRYSDGVVGSDQASDRWLYLSDYSTQGGVIYEGAGANIYAQWEEARKKDLGIEMGFLENMFTLNIELFDEKRSRMLLEPQSVTMLVANDFKQLNLGRMKKHGIELEAGFNRRTSSGSRFYITGNLGFNENRILFRDDMQFSPEHRKSAGTPLGSQGSGVELTGTGYYTSIDDIHNNPAPVALNKLVIGDYKFMDYTADGMINQLDKHYIEGTDFPPITYALTNGFEFKGFDFRFMLQGNHGKYIDYNGAFESEFLKGVHNVHQSALDYWRPDNQNANHQTLHLSNGAIDNLNWGNYKGDPGYTSMIPGRFWRKANYLRLREVFLAYTFNTNSLKRVAGISNLQVYATGNNLLTFTKLIEGDPERRDFSYGFYPQMRSVKLGMRVNF